MRENTHTKKRSRSWTNLDANGATRMSGHFSGSGRTVGKIEYYSDAEAEGDNSAT